MFCVRSFVAFCLLLSVNGLDKRSASDNEEHNEQTEILQLLKKIEEDRESSSNSSGYVIDILKNLVGNESSIQQYQQVISSGVAERSNCTEGKFKCKEGRLCIDGIKECDGLLDCSDGSDEVDCFECKLDFPYGQLLPAVRACDGVPDCQHGEDEHACKSPCGYSEFRCDKTSADTLCIPHDWTCDSYPDCPGITDESLELCGDLSKRCSPTDFICKHQLFCVHENWKCDHEDDCGDNSDEQLCNSREADSDTYHDYLNETTSWGEWNSWSDCDSECDGIQIRRRRCQYAPCVGRTVDTKECGKPHPCMIEPSEGCGTREFEYPTGRIFGGMDARPREWPWQVQIFRPGRTLPFCGGSLIKSDWVLTAAHCFNNNKYKPEEYSVALGRQHTSRKVTDDNEVYASGKKLVIHDSFKWWSTSNDIALLRLAKNVKTTHAINVVCMPTIEQDWFEKSTTKKQNCIVTGYGLNEIGRRPLVMQEASVHIIDHKSCTAPHVYGRRVTSSMICAGHLEGGIDACQGDSGGPLTCQFPDDGRWYQVGITSWGKGCGLPNRPGVYTRVSMYLDWIEKNTKNPK